MTPRSITVAGAGIIGLWQALTLARAGHRVRLVERSEVPFAASASRYAGGMLAPDCEAEIAPPIVRDLGHRGLALWREVFPGVVDRGTLVVAGARDRPDLVRFARMTSGHTPLDTKGIGALEPDLAGRFGEGLHFARESHVVTPEALEFLLAAVREAGAEVRFGAALEDARGGDDVVVVDCRGMAARNELPGLRGVRGEQALIGTREVGLSRPVRLLHPRFPLYVVPWGGGRYLVGATMIESEDEGPATVRSALELLGAAYALHPAFGEAEILEIGAGVRPAFPDNVPRAIVREEGRRIHVNGAYRHGYLLAPVLAEAVAGFIATGRQHDLLHKMSPSGRKAL